MFSPGFERDERHRPSKPLPVLYIRIYTSQAYRIVRFVVGGERSLQYPSATRDQRRAVGLRLACLCHGASLAHARNGAESAPYAKTKLVSLLLARDGLTLTLEIAGANPAAVPSYMVGLDCVKLSLAGARGARQADEK